MLKFQILCVTMHQTDFSKLAEMNIHSDIVFANQCGRTAYEETEFEGHLAKMISTGTRGVGKNRNLALTYADADVCLFADDDVRYVDDLETKVLSEFEAHPDADVVIFHLDTDGERKQIKYPKTRKCKKFERMPWGGCRIAIRLSSVQKANVWFTTMFGGGCIFPSGEDSMWLSDAKKRGLTFYVSEHTIGKVSFDNSSWFTGYDEKFYFGKGAFYAAAHPKTAWLWRYYFAFRSKGMAKMTLSEKIRWMKLGSKGYETMQGFDAFKEKLEKE